MLSVSSSPDWLDKAVTRKHSRSSLSDHADYAYYVPHIVTAESCIFKYLFLTRPCLRWNAHWFYLYHVTKFSNWKQYPNWFKLWNGILQDSWLLYYRLPFIRRCYHSRKLIFAAHIGFKTQAVVMLRISPLTWQTSL